MTQKSFGHWRILIADTLRLDESTTFNESDKPYSNYLGDIHPLPSSKATSVYQAKLNLVDHSVAVFVKHFYLRSKSDHYKQYLRKSRALKAVAADTLLGRHGFIAPTTLIVGWQQIYGLKSDFFTVSSALEGYNNIYDQIDALSQLGRKPKRDFLRALAEITASLHNNKISHGDMRPGNVLCKRNDTWKFAYIDNERTKKHWRLSNQARIKNLVQLNLLITPSLSRSDRLYFFQTYCERCFGTFNRKLLTQVLKKTHERMTRLLKAKRIKQSDMWL